MPAVRVCRRAEENRRYVKVSKNSFHGSIGMNARQIDRSFFARPNAAVYLLITANVFIYGLCLAQTGMAAIPADVLLRYGAMYSFAIGRHEYGRRVHNAFLPTSLHPPPPK